MPPPPPTVLFVATFHTLQAFSNSSAIAKHKLTHSEERKYVCGICHKAFKRQDHLDARSLRRHYENAHPEEYSRWLVLSQATNGDTSAIAVAAAAALFSSSSSGLDKESTEQAAKELHMDPSTSAVLTSVLNGPVRGVLTSSLNRAAGWGTSSDVLKAARSESASPASTSAINEHHGCSVSTATSPTGPGDTLDRDEDETHETRPPIMTLTAENMAAAAKVALIMAHPLEAPKRVACAVCQKRFKNQSALNGHMRLHGGYGPAGLAVSGAAHGSTGSSQVKTGRSHPPEDCYSTGPTAMEFDDKSNDKMDTTGPVQSSQVSSVPSSSLSSSVERFVRDSSGQKMLSYVSVYALKKWDACFQFW
ncbi:unnamed protein product [Echinostoma caproni]|uniref:C2H2-type domain-containing protein n=1 Tax=Echinostoma caproni TaxID=27848 RepID=A0A3P8HYE7_9TREM|nr:unnamed protein product [Echinostoma caproni]